MKEKGLGHTYQKKHMHFDFVTHEHKKKISPGL